MLIESDVNDNPEFPALADLVNKTAYGPALTIGGKVFDQFDEVARDHPLCEVDLKFATANVRSLKEHDTNLLGRLAFLQSNLALRPRCCWASRDSSSEFHSIVFEPLCSVSFRK